jgi:transcriptional regulator with XRE-family HTH domain
MARPIKYIEGIHDAWAASLAMEGLTDSEIAKRMQIAKSTLYKWEKDFPAFSDALKTGKEPADAKVKQSLFKRATGYDVKEKKVIVELDKDGNQKPAKIETIDKHIAPDVGAICFWLKNRLPKDWRDVQDVKVSGNPFEELMKAATSETAIEREEKNDDK